MTTPTPIARAICCAGPCQTPAACAATDTTRMHLISIRQAAERVQPVVDAAVAEGVRAYQRTVCARWKAMSFNVDRNRK